MRITKRKSGARASVDPWEEEIQSQAAKRSREFRAKSPVITKNQVLLLRRQVMVSRATSPMGTMLSLSMNIHLLVQIGPTA